MKKFLLIVVAFAMAFAYAAPRRNQQRTQDTINQEIKLLEEIADLPFDQIVEKNRIILNLYRDIYQKIRPSGVSSKTVGEITKKLNAIHGKICRKEQGIRKKEKETRKN